MILEPIKLSQVETLKDLGEVANLSNVDTLLDGSDADALHVHGQYATIVQMQAAVAGIEWQDSVADYIDAATGAETEGTRYLVAATGTLAITGVDTGTETFTVAGDQTLLLSTDDVFKVKGSTGNDGTYTVVTSTFDVDHTDVVVAEDITNAVVDGDIYYAGSELSLGGPDVIAEKGASTWSFTTPTEGMQVQVDDVGFEYKFKSDAWVKDSFSTSEITNIGTVVGGGDITDSLHTHSQYSETTHNHDSDYISIVGGAVENNIATFDASGEVKDSGSVVGDFATAGHNHDTTYVALTGGILKAEVDFDVDTVTLNADDGTGINVASIQIAEDAMIIGVICEVTQGSGDAGDTVEIHVTPDNVIGSSVAEIIADFAANAATNEVYYLATGTGVTLYKMTSTNQYVTAFFKDVGNDDLAATALQGKLTVLYVKQ